MRESIDSFYIRMARFISERSTCTRRKVGAIIVRDKMVLGVGYNGVPSKIKHCTKETCIRTRLNIPSGERHELCYGVHSEANAIATAAKNGVNINNSTLYCTTYPCAYCAKIIVSSGISKVVYSEGYPDELSKTIMQNIEVVKYEEEEE